MSVFYVLICIVSLTLQSPVSLNIHNRCQGINLTSPVYFIHGGEWCIVPNQEINVDAVMQNRLEFDSGQDILEGALIYRIRRQHAESDKSAHDSSKNINLLVAWYVEHTKELHIRALLVEHDKEFDEDKLRGLYQKCWQSLNVFVSPSGCDWKLDDATILKTTVKTMNGGYRYDIFITEEEGNRIERPLWIDAER
jgi:hypothetical protein